MIHNIIGSHRTIDRWLSICGFSFLIHIKDRIKTKRNIRLNSKKKFRQLEIGPGNSRIPGFESLNINDGRNIDYIADIYNKLPFESNSFNLIYCSHALEHLPWFRLEFVLSEFYRVLRPEGRLEIWVPNGLKIAKNLLSVEEAGVDNSNLDGWYRLNPSKNPWIWASARIFSYGNETNDYTHPNWHRSLLTPNFLRCLFRQTGFRDITLLENTQVRGYDHGWINLGMSGVK